MPKIYEYLGIVIFFYSKEHEPIHVHARYGRFETKAEFLLLDGKIVEIRLKSVKRAKPLSGKDLGNFKIFLETYSDQIVKKWIDFFVYRRMSNLKEFQKD